MANFYAFYPPSAAAGSNASVGLNGATAPTSSTEIGFIDGSGNEAGVSASNPLPVTVVSGPNPTNVNLAQVGGSAITEGQKTMAASLPVAIASDQSTIPVSAASLPLPAGASTSALQTTGNTSLASIDGKLNSLGQKAMAASVPVTIASDQSAVPVSAASLPLPSGAATSANQTNGNQIAQIIDPGGVNKLSIGASGNVLVSGLAAVGNSPVLNPITVSGVDQAGNKQYLKQVTGTNALIVDGSAVTQPISGTVTANTPANTAPATQNITVVDSGSTNTAQANGQNAITGSPTANSAASFSVSTEESFEVQITGTWTGTLASEISFDGGTVWFTRGIKQSGSSYISSSFTQNFQGGGSVAGATNYRVRATAAVTGTATVKVVLSENQASIVVSNPQLLRDGTTQSVLNTIKAASTAAVATDTALVVAISPNNNIPVAPPAAATAQAFSLSSATSQTYNVSQYSILSINVTGAGSSNTWVYEVTNDNVNWQSILAWPILGGTANVGSTAIGTWTINVSAWQQFRIRVAIYGSGTVAGTMYELPAGQVIPLGQQLQQISTPVALAVENVQDLYVIGATAQTATVNNVLTTAAGAAATDLTGYRSASVQVLCNATGGTFIFEGSNDNTTFVSIPVYNQALTAGAVIVAAITATVSSIIYTFPVNCRYVRLRIATTLTGGTGISPFSKFMQMNWTPATFEVVQATNSNLNLQAQLTAGTAIAGSFNLTLPNTVQDIASAAITVTTTTAAFTPQNGIAYSINIPVTAVAGTAPTMSVALQESQDSGTNWQTIYTFPLITATGYYVSPYLICSGNRVRYVQTITGSAGQSFTRSLNRMQSGTSSQPYYRNLIDTTINPTSTNSVTSSVAVENTHTYTAIVNQGAGGSGVTFAMDGSTDNVNWVNAIATCVGVVGGATPVSMFYSGANYRFIRVRVVTGIAATTISYVDMCGSQGSNNSQIAITSALPAGSNNIGLVSASQGSLTNRSGSTSGTPGTSTTVMSSNASRKYLLLQNLDATSSETFNFTSAADTSNSILLAPGQSFVMEGFFISVEAITVQSAGTSVKYCAKEG